MSCGIGLYAVYGTMGAGKTNFVVNNLLKDTKYQKVISNVKFTDEFINSLPNIEFITYDKYDVLSVIASVNPNNPNSFIIVDECQLVLQNKQSKITKDFMNACTRIRQDNQVVILITQSSEFLPSGLLDIIYQSFKLTSQKQKAKSLEKISILETFQGGIDYQTKLIDKTIYKMVYGNYETSNFDATEKPKILLGKQKIIIIVCSIIFILAVIFVIKKVFQAKDFFMHRKNVNKEKVEENITLKTNNQVIENLEQTTPQTQEICVRTYHTQGAIIYAIDSLGYQKIYSLNDFLSVRKCPTF
jgi:hypothetical protein